MKRKKKKKQVGSAIKFLIVFIEFREEIKKKKRKWWESFKIISPTDHSSIYIYI